MELNILNPEDRDYHEGKLYRVSLWSGAGYSLYTYDVYANYEEEALNLAVKYAERDEDPVIFSYEEVEQDAVGFYEGSRDEDLEEFIDNNYIYVDATIEGANEPYFVLRENANIEEIKEEN